MRHLLSQKRGLRVGKTKRGKGTKLMAVADRSGLPLAVYPASAAPHEITLVGETLAQVFTAERPERLIGDKAYDSDPLDEELREQGVEMIAPHKSNRKKAPTQDGRVLRRYKEGGRSSDCSPGSRTSAGLRCASTFMTRTISDSFIWAVSGFCSDAIYETASSYLYLSRLLKGVTTSWQENRGLSRWFGLCEPA
jgi:Transposase DDE domain